jgi:wyosine [tRNA(Phe)-imidazoG37] synthetase (radical SAM superfamily)
MLKHVFGPVPSRRLGRSLGIDPVPLKTCNWNCVYCQLGRTRPLTNDRCAYVDPDLIVAEVASALDHHADRGIDWVTFVGSGEPTLHSGLGPMIQQVKSLTTIPVAVITNGALLHLPAVRRDLAAADMVLPSLDAGSEALYRSLNRPHPHNPFHKYVAGLVAFRDSYRGQMCVEVMLIRGQNDTETALCDISRVLADINPDEIHINQPIRPPAEPWVQPTDEEGLLRARAILGEKVQIFSVIAGSYNLGLYDQVADAILAIITRHPMRQSELEHTLSAWGGGEVNTALNELVDSGRAQKVERYGVTFWSSVESYYPNNKPISIN